MSDRRIAFAVLALAASAPAAAAEFELLPLAPPRTAVVRPVNVAPSRPVCVRLCDGYFFPLAPASGPFAAAAEEEACRALCPAASVALYRLPGSSDTVAQAISATGEPYSALPTAFRYRVAAAPACGCRRAGDESGLDYWRDPTLRSGDAVMTAAGLVVFRGAGGGPYSQADFAPLDGAPIGALQRSALTGFAPARLADQTSDDGQAIVRGQGIIEARRAGGASPGGEIRFRAAPAGGGG